MGVGNVGFFTAMQGLVTILAQTSILFMTNTTYNHLWILQSSLRVELTFMAVCQYQLLNDWTFPTLSSARSLVASS